MKRKQVSQLSRKPCKKNMTRFYSADTIKVNPKHTAVPVGGMGGGK